MSKKDGFYIAIEGNIGSGKTTLSKLLAPLFNARLILEEFEENPFLANFYKDPERYGFSVEMSFLADRYHQLSSKLSHDDLFQPTIISDYTPFKSLIFSQANLSDKEYKLYRDFWNMSLGKLPKPDLVLYLSRPLASLKQNISKRGRTYEQNISESYLKSIGLKYDDYFKLYPQMQVLKVEADEYDFLKSKEDLNLVFQSICKVLNI